MARRWTIVRNNFGSLRTRPPHQLDPTPPPRQCCDDLTTDSVPEGLSNAYFTELRVARSVERARLAAVSAMAIRARNLTVSGQAELSTLTVDNSVTAASFTTKSDIRLKRDIEGISEEHGREVVAGLRACTYAYNDDPTQLRAGFIAQEVHDVAPHLVSSNSDGMLGVDMLGVIPYLVAEVKGLRAELKAVRGELTLGKHRAR